MTSGRACVVGGRADAVTLHGMAEDEHQQDHTLQLAATANSGPEADLICQRLEAAGIRATTQRSIGGPEWGVSGSRYVYVEAERLARAHELLAAPDGLSEDELAKMAEEAALTPPTDQPTTG
jgi:hypothetical protein